MIDACCPPAPLVGLQASARPPVESLCLPGQGLTLTETLRVLDVLRRRVARKTRGHEGAFAGFDVLDVSQWQEEAESAPVVFTARLVVDDRKSQVVEYAAWKCAHRDGLCRKAEVGDPYLRGCGRTVGLTPSEVRAPFDRTFSIAPPHR